MQNLGLDRLDLLLIHWPAPGNDLYLETWETFIELRDTGRVTSIGVSNFEPEHLGRHHRGRPGWSRRVNQIELHPYLQQRTLLAFHQLHGIATEAWGPIARGRVADDPVLQRIGEAHGKSPAQVALRWEIQLGIVDDPEVGAGRAHGGEHRRVRLRAHRRRDGRDRAARPRRPHRSPPAEPELSSRLIDRR